MFKLGTGILTVASVVVLWAPSALAATPEEIYNDLADNGQLNETYTQADLQAYVQSASVQGYGNPVVISTVAPPTIAPAVTPPGAPPAGVAPIVAAPGKKPAAPKGGVAGTSKTIVKAKPKAKPNAKPVPVAQTAGVATPPLARTASAETLPFTGAELAMFALVGAALLLGGILLRVSSRQR